MFVVKSWCKGFIWVTKVYFFPPHKLSVSLYYMFSFKYEALSFCQMLQQCESPPAGSFIKVRFRRNSLKRLSSLSYDNII